MKLHHRSGSPQETEFTPDGLDALTLMKRHGCGHIKGASQDGETPRVCQQQETRTPLDLDR